MLGFLWFVSVYAYPIPDSIAVRLQGFVSTLEQFGKALPQEKVYLHFDNTGYYQEVRLSPGRFYQSATVVARGILR